MTRPLPEEKPRKGQDHRLLLKGLYNAEFDQAGTEFVRRAFTGGGLVWEEIDTAELISLASIAQQHGLIDQSLEILGWLNDHHPSFEEGWVAHLDLLQLLDQRSELATLFGRLSRHLSAEQVAELHGKYLGLGQQREDEGTEGQIVLEPFKQLRQEQEDNRLFLGIFKGREDAFARQWADRDQGKQGYVPVQRPFLDEDLREHLQGRKTYGIYLLDSDSRARLGVIDVDLIPRLRSPQEAKKEKDLLRREAIYLYRRIRELAGAAGLQFICEASGGKGYHFWFPATEPVSAAVMKNAMQALIKPLVPDVKCFNLEVFPKQEKLTGKGYGNLVKLPLGIHRVTGNRSRFIPTGSDKQVDQFALLRTVQPAPPGNFLSLAETNSKATIFVHPRQAEMAKKYPELIQLAGCCPPLGQLFAVARSGKDLSLREEKVLLSVLAHLPRGRLLLHHLFGKSPEYNRPLLDYKISRVRGTVLGCKRIHSLLDTPGADLPCSFDGCSYPHPLLHLPGQNEPPVPVSERVENLQDALLCLETAIEQVRRYL